MSTIHEALAAIEAQQKDLAQGSAPWCVGEQLKDILREEPAGADLVTKDLAAGMTLADCEKKIAAFAREHSKGKTGFCGPADSDRIIREFFGLPARQAAPIQEDSPAPARRRTIRLTDFM